jgi:hypothetical protein
VKHLSGAPPQGKLLALTTNIRLVWKNLPWTNASLLQKFINYDRKMFYNIGCRSQLDTQEKEKEWL